MICNKSNKYNFRTFILLYYSDLKTFDLKFGKQMKTPLFISKGCS